jgi:hypothetical protein
MRRRCCASVSRVEKRSESGSSQHANCMFFTCRESRHEKRASGSGERQRARELSIQQQWWTPLAGAGVEVVSSVVAGVDAGAGLARA